MSIKKIIWATLLCVVFVLSSKSQVVAGFTADKTSGCSPLVVNFTNTSTPATGLTYSWDFENGTSNLKSPPNTFVTPGQYHVVLAISDGVNVDTARMIVTVFSPPTVDFTANKTTVCLGDTVCFINQSIAGSGALQSYAWDFGQAPGSNLANPCVKYNNVGQYNITLLAQDANGCAANITKNNFITVYSLPTASFTKTTTNTCQLPQVYNYSSTSTGNSLTYQWHFGNGTSGNTANASATYTATGTFSDTLIVIAQGGCTARAIQQVSIGNADANFSANKVTLCVGDTVRFTNTSNPIGTAWSWNFGFTGAGSTSTLSNPSAIYNTPGTYSVSLISTNGSCKDTLIKTNYITVQAKPVINFSVSDSTKCKTPLSVTFTPSNNTFATYSWDFGVTPTATSSAIAPTYVYNQMGSFSPSLTVTDANGCKATIQKSNKIVLQAITATFVTLGDSGCVPFVLKVDNTTVPSSPISSIVWNWGDMTPNSSGDTASHIYTAEGTYTLTLTVTTTDGCVSSTTKTIKTGNPPTVDFSATPLIACLSENVIFTNLSTGGIRYFWDFSDGTDMLENPVHKFIDTGYHDIKLSVFNNGCRVDTIKEKYIYSLYPKAMINTQKDCNNPLRVLFNDTSILSTSRTWYFGDPANSSSTLKSPSFTYPSFGTYSVLLLAYNSGNGCMDSVRLNITLGPVSVAFGNNKNSGCAPLSVVFSDSSVGAASWYWDFGNGKTSTTKNPTCLYDTPGVYSVKLVINRSSQCPDSIIKTNLIVVRGINTNFIADTTKGCAPLNVHFSNTSTILFSQLSKWKWDFGVSSLTNDTSNLQSPTYTYTLPGLYTVKLTATDTSGCAVTKTIANYIDTRKPVANFKADTVRCLGELDSFINLSTGAVSYLWNFGDGDTSSARNPLHAYRNYGRYTVTLKAFGANGCDSTLIRNLYIHIDSPKVDFNISGTIGNCPPTALKFKNISNRKDMTFEWIFGDGKNDTTRASKDSVTHIYFYPGTYTVSLIGKSKYGCIDTMKKVNIVVIPGPMGTFTISPLSGCAPLKVNVTANFSTNVHYSVFQMEPGVVYNNVTSFSHTYNNGGAYAPIVILTDTTTTPNCVVTYYLDTVRVGNTPLPNIPNDTSMCENDTIQFDLGLGTTYSMMLIAGGPDGLSCHNCQTPIFTGSDTATYAIRVSNGSGCDGLDTVTINVDPLPILNPLDTITLCRREVFMLNAADTVPLLNATWSPATYLNDSSLIRPTITVQNDITYTVSSANHLGCKASKPISIKVLDAVDMYGFKNDTICVGDTVHLWTSVFDSSASGVTYKWTPNNYLNTADTLAAIVAQPPADMTYTITAYSSTCTPSVQSFFIKVNTAPTLTLGGDVLSTPGAPIRLYAQSSAQNATYQWLPQTTDDISCIYCRVATFKPLTPQIIIMEVTSEDGCVVRDTLDLRIFECDPKFIFVPNTFTPNSDGQNEVFRVRSEIIKELEFFRVFDRWGNIVFDSKDINKGWDGTYGSKEAQSGVYVYSLSAICSNGSNIKKSGNVTLVR